MIGLEYILDVYKVSQTELADELGIKKQNITLWLKGKQSISKKYLPILVKKFKIPKEYLQKELTEIDKIFIQKRYLAEHIDKTKVEYIDTIWDEETQEYVAVKKLHYDTEAIEHARILEAEEKEIKTINKIRGVINDVEEYQSFDIHIEMFENNIALFDRYADIIKSKKLSNTIIFETLRALELCIPELAKQNRVLGEERNGVMEETYKYCRKVHT